MPAELFNRTFSPASDDYLHVARLRGVPIRIVVACGAVVVFCGLIVWGVLAQAGTTPDMQGPMPYIIASGFGLLGVFFLLSFANAIAAAVSRGSWSNRQCIAFGRSGISLRLQGRAVDLPWQAVTGVHAMILHEGDARRRSIPVLRVERGREHWDLQPAVIDASPIAVCTLLRHYWMHPAERQELGTVSAQQRMDELAARF